LISFCRAEISCSCQQGHFCVVILIHGMPDFAKYENENNVQDVTQRESYSRQNKISMDRPIH
jgi:hypothetical protein